MKNNENLSLNEVLKAGSWITRNFPRAVDWFNLIKNKLLGKAAIALAALSIVGCTTIVRLINTLPDIPPTPRPPVVSEPLPTSQPTVAATSIPTPSPSPTPTPLVIPIPTVKPNCIPKPSQELVTLLYKGECPKYMELLDFYGEGEVNAPGDKKLCAVKWGSGDQRTAWRLGYGLGRQGMRLQRFGDNWLQFDPGRGCTDAYGRHSEDCVTVYTHPDPNEKDPEFSWGGYSKPDYCEDIPVPTATPAGPIDPRGASCSCQVICTARFLGWNDREGIPPTTVIGGQASIDITCRQAQFPGDQRGQPVDRSSGPEWCEPSENPVLWDINIPGGVEAKVGGDGYRLDLKNLEAGSYSIRVRPNPNAVYKNGDSIQLCPWEHNDSVKDFVEFSL